MRRPLPVYPVWCQKLRQCGAGILLLTLTLVAQGVDQSIAHIDPALYLNDIKELTAPAMEGRGDDTKGLTRAAHLLEHRYHALGLRPAGSRITDRRRVAAICPSSSR